MDDSTDHPVLGCGTLLSVSERSASRGISACSASHGFFLSPDRLLLYLSHPAFISIPILAHRTFDVYNPTCADNVGIRLSHAARIIGETFEMGDSAGGFAGAACRRMF